LQSRLARRPPARVTSRSSAHVSLFVDLLQYGGGQTGSDRLEQAESRLPLRHAREHQLVPASARA